MGLMDIIFGTFKDFKIPFDQEEVVEDFGAIVNRLKQSDICVQICNGFEYKDTCRIYKTTKKGHKFHRDVMGVKITKEADPNYGKIVVVYGEV